MRVAKIYILAALLLIGTAQAEEKLRAFNTDRPDKTESAYTVPRGHFQFETDLVNFTHDKSEQAETKTYNIHLANLKFGVAQNSDLQLVLGFVHQVSYQASNRRHTTNSISDTVIRFKQNLYGNDSGGFAMAVMPFVVLPTAKKEVGVAQTEAGLIVPFAQTLPNPFSLAYMLQLGLINNSNNTGYREHTILSVALNCDFTQRLAAYIELFGALNSDRGSPFVATLDGGITYEFIDNWQADVGMNYGLTQAAIDYNPFVGLSARF